MASNTTRMSTENRFTPGEWRVSADGTEVTASRLGILEGSKRIADCSNGLKPDDEVLANARLISASKNMYEALKEVLAYEKRCADKGEPRIGNGILSIIRAALRKAEGGANG